MLSPKKQKRSSRVRFKLKKNNKSRMRLTLYKSSQHLYAQIVDDNKGITICSASTLKSEKNRKFKSSMEQKMNLENFLTFHLVFLHVHKQVLH